MSPAGGGDGSNYDDDGGVPLPVLGRGQTSGPMHSGGNLGEIRKRGVAASPGIAIGRAYVVDGNAYMNRPGPRLVDSAEMLAGLIQPGFCASLMPASGWERI